MTLSLTNLQFSNARMSDAGDEKLFPSIFQIFFQCGSLTIFLRLGLFTYFVKIESAPPIPEPLVALYFKKEDTKVVCLVFGKVFSSHLFSLQRYHKVLLFCDNALFSNCRKTFTPYFDTIIDYLI